MSLVGDIDFRSRIGEGALSNRTIARLAKLVGAECGRN